MSNLVKTIIGFVLSAAIAAGAYFTGAKPSNEALELVTDTSKAAKACESLLKGQGYGVVIPVTPIENVVVPKATIE